MLSNLQKYQNKLKSDLILCLITSTSCCYCKCLSTSSSTIQVRHYCTIYANNTVTKQTVNPHFRRLEAPVIATVHLLQLTIY